MRECEVDVLREGQGVVAVPLRTQGERLETLQEEKGAEGVEGGSEVAQNFDADFDCECDGAEGLAKLQTVVALRRLGEVRESTGLRPVEFACQTAVNLSTREEHISGCTRVDDHTTNGSAMAANPFCCAMNDNIGAVLDWADEVALSGA